MKLDAKWLERKLAEAPDEPSILGGGHMKQIEVEALAEVAPILGVVKAWRQFKRYHDVADAKTCCCKHTQKLFDELNQLEKQILAL